MESNALLLILTVRRLSPSLSPWGDAGSFCARRQRLSLSLRSFVRRMGLEEYSLTKTLQDFGTAQRAK